MYVGFDVQHSRIGLAVVKGSRFDVSTSRTSASRRRPAQHSWYSHAWVPHSWLYIMHLTIFLKRCTLSLGRGVRSGLLLLVPIPRQSWTDLYSLRPQAPSPARKCCGEGNQGAAPTLGETSRDFCPRDQTVRNERRVLCS